MKTIGVLVLLVAVGGCGNAHKMNRLSIGMTKAEVIKAMGRRKNTEIPKNYQTRGVHEHSVKEIIKRLHVGCHPCLARLP